MHRLTHSSQARVISETQHTPQDIHTSDPLIRTQTTHTETTNMSYCQQIGKDRIIFATREDHSTPSTVVLAEETPDESMRGLILTNGDINWNCPCLGGMSSGPCGYQFREAFSCFHYSQSETKGQECMEKFPQERLH
ncbi:unnamed protein product, partial [Medioppia subpectinata]